MLAQELRASPEGQNLNQWSIVESPAEALTSRFALRLSSDLRLGGFALGLRPFFIMEDVYKFLIMEDVYKTRAREKIRGYKTRARGSKTRVQPATRGVDVERFERYLRPVNDYEVSWQIFGTRVVTADSPDDAHQQVGQWLEDEHGMDKSVVDGWDYEVTKGSSR